MKNFKTVGIFFFLFLFLQLINCGGDNKNEVNDEEVLSKIEEETQRSIGEECTEGNPLNDYNHCLACKSAGGNWVKTTPVSWECQGTATQCLPYAGYDQARCQTCRSFANTTWEKVNLIEWKCRGGNGECLPYAEYNQSVCSSCLTIPGATWRKVNGGWYCVAATPSQCVQHAEYTFNDCEKCTSSHGVWGKVSNKWSCTCQPDDYLHGNNLLGKECKREDCAGVSGVVSALSGCSSVKSVTGKAACNSCFVENPVPPHSEIGGSGGVTGKNWRCTNWTLEHFHQSAIFGCEWVRGN